MKLEVTGSPSGPSRKVTVCALSAPQPSDQLADRLGLAVRPRPGRRASRPWPSWAGPRRRCPARTPSWSARPTARTRTRPDRGDRAARCSRHRRDRRAPAPSGTSQPAARSTSSTPSSDLVLNATSSGIFALRRRSRVRAPVLGQIQRPPQRHRPPRTDRVHRHPDLTVTPLAQRPRVLALDTRRVLAVLRKPGVIQHPRLDLDLRRDPLRHRLDHQRRIPRAVSHELLHRLIVSVTAQPLDDRLKRLARPLLQAAPADTTRH